MKRKLILFAVLLFALCLVTAIACAEISNVQFRREANGKITITWSDSENAAPYEVHWYQDNWVDYWWHQEDSYPSPYAQMEYLVPGAAYQINIKNSLGTSVTVPYTVPKGTFTDWKSEKGVKIEIDELNGQDFNAMTMNRYIQFRFILDYPRIKSARTYNWILALQTPYVYIGRVFWNDMMTLDPKYAWTYWDLDFSEWINEIEATYGGKIPSGIYYAEAYLNGDFYASYGFRIYGN